MCFLTFFATVAHTSLNGTINFGCFVTTRTVGFGVRVATVGAAFVIAGLLGRGLSGWQIIGLVGEWLDID